MAQLVQKKVFISSSTGLLRRLEESLNIKEQEATALKRSFKDLLEYQSYLETQENAIFVNAESLFPEHWNFLFEGENSHEDFISATGFTPVEYLNTFSYDRLNELSSLNLALQALRLKLAKEWSFKVISEIKIVLAKIKDITFRQLMKVSRKVKALRRKITIVFRKTNLRNQYRKLIQFLFKNMDDESGDSLIASTCDTIIVHLLSKQHEVQGSRYRSFKLRT